MKQDGVGRWRTARARVDLANLSFYDALHVALAVRLGAPLLTADTSLARTPGLSCDVEIV